jgi:two-component system response regulator AtoC
VDVRVIAASNQNLQEQIVAGRFREDLFYRLNVIPIEVPSLRRRKEDIPALVEHFITLFSVENGGGPRRCPWRPSPTSLLRLAGQCARAPQHGGAARHHGSA